MRSTPVCFILLGIASAAWAFTITGMASDEPGKAETPDQRFEKLLTAARKAPEKANWKELRAAFSKTRHYQPHSIDVTRKLEEVARSIGRGEIRSSEAALLALIERERFMRLDSLAMLMMLYEKTGQPKKAEEYRKWVDGILGVLQAPEAGTSFAKPIQILFIQEESFVTFRMPVKEQGLVIRDGHWFDVLELKADGDRPARKVYFDVDLTRNARSILEP
ncbi:MAG: hypothetical protein ACYC61_25130 [Isosphaeraceae bacterium]